VLKNFKRTSAASPRGEGSEIAAVLRLYKAERSRKIS